MYNLPISIANLLGVHPTGELYQSGHGYEEETRCDVWVEDDLGVLRQRFAQ
jgi:hypothetical protein